MRVAEKFISINGEGPRAGELSVFVRFSGCNLRCSYCDTLWANEKDCPVSEESPEALAETIKNTGIANATLTGGEPLLQERGQLLELFKRLEKEQIRTEVETNGAVDIAPFCGEGRPAFTMDYKLPGSGCEEQMCLSNYGLLQPQDTVKFVCGSFGDLERARQVMETYRLTEICHVYLSPVFGRIDPAKMVEFMQEKKMNGVRLQLQLHKFIWDPDKRGV